MDVKTVEELTERLEKMEKKWKDEYQKLIEKEREKSEENTKLKATMEELREENLKLIRQLLDLQDNEKRSPVHQCNCQQLQALLDRAKDEAKKWESAANCWKIEYEVVLQQHDNQ